MLGGTLDEDGDRIKEGSKTDTGELLQVLTQAAPDSLLTSTQVSISGNWLMMGSTASMVLPGRRSDLLPTRMMGNLGERP